MGAQTSRLASRLIELPYNAVSALSAERPADEVEYKPLPQWAVEEVLLSSDLLPQILAPLQLEDGAARAVCLAWADGWRATSEGRRQLRKVSIEVPEELVWRPLPGDGGLATTSWRPAAPGR